MAQEGDRAMKVKNFCKFVILFGLTVLIIAAAVMAYRQELFRFLFFIILAVVLNMCLVSLVICNKIDERFDKLEKQIGEHKPKDEQKR